MAVSILNGDALAILGTLPDTSIDCCVTSPPYFGLRDYGMPTQIGLEPTPEEFIAKLVDVFRQVKRVLRDDGTLWVNMGDSYAGSGKGAWNISDEEKTRLGVKETYRPNVCVGGTGIGDTARDAAITMGKGEDRKFGLKAKDLIGTPWMLAFALRADGWYLRQDIIWAKPNPMPESVTDRCTKSHEYLFMLSKSRSYYYDQDAIKVPATLSTISRLSQDIENQVGSDRVPGKTNGPMKAVGKIDKQRGHGRRHAGFNDRWDAMEKAEQCGGMVNKRSVWSVATRPFKEAHFATFPPELIEPCILAGCPVDGTVLDPFFGAGTTGLVSARLQRNCIGIELNPVYSAIARNRIFDDAPLLTEIA